MTTLREKHRHIEQTVPLLEEELATTKEQMRNLTISEATYRELVAIPKERLTLRDFVRARCYEEVQASQSSNKELRDELRKAKEAQRKAEAEATRATRQMQTADREASSRDSTSQGDIAVLTARNEALHKELTNIRLLYEEGKGISAAAEQNAARLEALTRKHDEACRELMISKAAVRALEDDRRANHDDYVERQKTVELLQVDKAYLTKEVQRHEEKEAELETTLAKKRAKLAELKKGRDEMIERLHRIDEERRESTEDAVARELKAIKERAEMEREAVRNNLKELYERESLALRDARDTAVAESERGCQKLKEAKIENEQLMATHRDMESRLSNQVPGRDA